MDDRLSAAKGICQRLTAAGYRALLAGGCVRDYILGIVPRDYDVATSATPVEVASLFDRCVDVGAAFGVQVVVLPEGNFEVATFRKDGPYLDGRHPDLVEFTGEAEDAKRRDFTINAMFLDPATDEIIDHVGGREDLRGKILRAVGDPRLRFEEDHLRILRAVRFAARLGYEIEGPTFESMARMAHLIVRTSPERVRDELLKILTEGGARRAFELLDKTGLLEHILPEVARMKGVEQPPKYHPEGDVFEHTLLTLDNMRDPSPTLAMAVLLHDAGKPLTQTFEDRIRFSNHDKTGARISVEIGRRLRMSNEAIAAVSWLIENHMRFTAIPNMRESKRKRLVREERFPELIELCRLDCMGSHNHLEIVDWVEDYAANLKPEDVKPPPLLGGKDLIEMGFVPGPLFTEILHAVEDAQLEGELSTPNGARAFVRDRWPRPRGQCAVKREPKGQA